MDNKDLLIQLRHDTAETECQTETITFSPLNTPVLDLSNDDDSITYKSDGTTKVSGDVSTTAGVYLNGELINNQMEILWLLFDCKATLTENQVDIKEDTDTKKWYENGGGILPEQVIKGSSNTLTVSQLSANNAKAACWAFEKLYTPEIIVYRPGFSEDG